MHSRIRKYPIVHFTIVIHPTFKSDGSLDAPTAKYRRALGYIQEFPNVTVVGYIDAGFGKRNLKQLLSDVERLWGWREKFNYFGDNGSGPRGLDGVFIDAVGGEQQHIRALEELCKDVKSRRWRAGKSGYNHIQDLNLTARVCRSKYERTPKTLFLRFGRCCNCL